jgi:tetratricopeptide (TPR) repeat protein
MVDTGTGSRRVAVGAWRHDGSVPVNQLSEIERVERQLDDVMSARPRDYAACIVALREAVALTRTDPDAEEVFYLPELLDELATAYSESGLVDEALRTMQEAIDAGLGGEPDSRCRIAEILMRAGRVVEAEPIWAQVRAETPGDVWLFNNAGLEYADVGDHATALAWLTDGLRIALDSGDPERLVGQLVDLRRASMDALGVPPDDLQARAVDVDTARQRDADERLRRTLRPPLAASRPPSVVVGPPVWSWFPAGEFDQARDQWPGLTQEPDGLAAGGRSHVEYCRALQAKLVQAAESGLPSIRIAPIRVDDLLAWCAERGEDPVQARRGYVTALAQDHPGQLIAWPPGRNDACWCGSTRKYKKCCGAPRAGERG